MLKEFQSKERKVNVSIRPKDPFCTFRPESYSSERSSMHSPSSRRRFPVSPPSPRTWDPTRSLS